MKKIALIAVFLFGLTVASVANSRVEIVTVLQTTETGVPDNNPQVSISNPNATALTDSPVSSNHKKKKKWKDRSLAAKILIIAGISVFAVLCILFGTVSVGV